MGGVNFSSGHTKGGFDIGGNAAATSGTSIVTPGRDLFSSKRIPRFRGFVHERETLELGFTPR